VSELPKGWTKTTLGEVGHWRGGGTPNKSTTRFWINGTIPWVSPKDMKRPIIDDAEDYITPEAVENSSTQLVPPGSILIVTRSGILKHSLPVAITTRAVAINQDIKAITPLETATPYSWRLSCGRDQMKFCATVQKQALLSIV
jgi:type I restriction enzyme S subunit